MNQLQNHGVPFARPRVGAATPQEYRARIMEDPRFYELRNQALDFLYNRFAHDERSNV
nr:hypothetical protein [Nodosilinea sp. TSF1-S3]